MKKIVITKLEKMNACLDAVEWIKQYNTFDEAWNNCERGDWMLWLIGKRIKNIKERKILALCACQCARLSLKYVKKGEKRPIQAIETAEKWANNMRGVTIKEVRSTASAAYAANAASAAAGAAYAASAASAAASAAYAANAAANAAYAAAEARKKVLKECANIVREFYPNYKF